MFFVYVLLIIHDIIYAANHLFSLVYPWLCH